MCWRGRWADRGCHWGKGTRIGLADDVHGSIDDVKVALLYGTCVGRWADRSGLWDTRTRTWLVDHAHYSSDDGKVALLHCTCVGEVVGLTEVAFDAQGLS